MRHGDLSLTVWQRKLQCVLDPALLLCHAQGPALAQRLTHVVEPWLTRSFWQVIDASELLLGRAEPLLPPGRTPAGPAPVDAAVAAWVALRDATDAGSWPYRWVGDNLAESQVRDAAGLEVVDRYEALYESLLRRLARALAAAPAPRRPPWWDLLECGADVLALSATLDAALVLSCLPPGQPEPWPAQAMRAAGIAVQHLDPPQPHSLFATERELVRDALASAGLAPLLRSLPPLAVLHVATPLADAGRSPAAGGTGDDEFGAAPSLVETADGCDLWRDAQAWWYAVEGASR